MLFSEIISIENLALALGDLLEGRTSNGRGMAPGVDDVSLREFLKVNDRDGVRRALLVSSLRSELAAGTYRHRPVRRVLIPKEGGKQRKLGIPTVRDRVVQQAVRRVIEPILEPQFSDSSFGYRPGKSVHDAIHRILSLTRKGYIWAVQIDLSSFFDTVDHDRLLREVTRLGGIAQDDQLLGLLRQFLAAEVVYRGKVSPADMGTPQGGVISPLLANVYLHEFDVTTTSWGFHLVRYADDILILTRSKDAAKTARFKAVQLLRQLKLKVNEDKSTIRNTQCPVAFLGFEIQKGKVYIPAGALQDLLVRYEERLSEQQDLPHPDLIYQGWVEFYRKASNAEQIFRRANREINRLKEAQLAKEDSPAAKRADQETPARDQNRAPDRTPSPKTSISNLLGNTRPKGIQEHLSLDVSLDVESSPLPGKDLVLVLEGVEGSSSSASGGG